MARTRTGLTFRDVNIRNIYIRNSNNGIVNKVTNYTERTSLTPTGINNECRCKNVLEQVV